MRGRLVTGRDAATVRAGPAVDPERGLSTAEAAARLAAEGPNVLAAALPASRFRLLAAQFGSPVVLVLLGAAVVSGLLGESLEALAIGAIVVLNGLVGFLQEARAASAIEALRRTSMPRARVIRDGRSALIPAAEVVRGDLLLVEAGDVVAADARLVEATTLEVNEALLTGESLPVAKRAGPRLPGATLGEGAGVDLDAERAEWIFAGTAITRGQGRAIVTAAGMATELGRIARLLETAGRETTPLQRRLEGVSKQLIMLCGGIVAVVFALGLLRGEPLLGMLLAALSLAVAAIPEGLPAVVTLTLAVGVQRMARRHALVRHLPAVETLGSAQVICSDKTGTLTVGELTVRRLWALGAAWRVTGEGYATEGTVVPDGPGGQDGSSASPSSVPAQGVMRRLLQVAVACNDAELTVVGGRPSVVGDPTEGALLVAAAKVGLGRAEVERAAPRVFLLPFEAERKRMTVVRRVNGSLVAYVKGAPDVLLERCSRVATPQGDVPLDEACRRLVLDATADFAGEALRVLALAERRLPQGLEGAAAVPVAPEEVEHDLTFLGLAGLEDPPRPEAAEAVRRCQAAGIRVVMITGDHPGTGAAVARRLGILAPGDEVLTGRDLDRMDDEALLATARTTPVYARVAPGHKLRIVRAFKRLGLVVAMTGDGVNDAPALREASVGIAMGRTGSEVTRQAADMVITDDNFASIVNAVEEGRRIFDNIQKTLLYLLAGNTGEILVMLVAALIGWPVPLLPVQILWVNFVTDGPPALGLATERVDPEALRRPPRPPGAEFADPPFLRRLVLAGTLIGLASLAGFWFGYRPAGDAVAGRSLAFAVLVASHVTWVFAVRSSTRTFWEAGPFTNLRLLAIVAVTFAVQIAIQSSPAPARVFGAAPLSPSGWAVAAGLGLLPVTAVELAKLVRRQLRVAGAGRAG